MPEEERALTEDELLFAGVPGAEALGEATSRGLRGRNGREIYLRVAESLPGDVDKGYALVHSSALEALGVKPGSLVTVEGRRTCVVRAEALPSALPGEQVIRMDGVLRDNALCGIDDRVRVRPGTAAGGFALVLVPEETGSLAEEELERIHDFLRGRIISPGDKVNLTCLPRGELLCKVVETEPNGAILITADTQLKGRVATTKSKKSSSIRYEEIGGLEIELRRVRELVELPMKFPQLFSRLRRRQRGRSALRRR
jgi:transitional endoplasmic reticulum ATPase